MSIVRKIFYYPRFFSSVRPGGHVELFGIPISLCYTSDGCRDENFLLGYKKKSRWFTTSYLWKFLKWEKEFLWRFSPKVSLFLKLNLTWTSKNNYFQRILLHIQKISSHFLVLLQVLRIPISFQVLGQLGTWDFSSDGASQHKI